MSEEKKRRIMYIWATGYRSGGSIKLKEYLDTAKMVREDGALRKWIQDNSR